MFHRLKDTPEFSILFHCKPHRLFFFWRVIVPGLGLISPHAFPIALVTPRIPTPDQRDLSRHLPHTPFHSHSLPQDSYTGSGEPLPSSPPHAFPLALVTPRIPTPDQGNLSRHLSGVHTHL